MSDKVTLEEAIKRTVEGFMEDGRPTAMHLAETLVEAAVEGDMRAYKMLLEYVIGRPGLTPEAVEAGRDLDAALRAALDKAYGVDDPEILFDKDGNPVERPYDSNHIPFK